MLEGKQEGADQGLDPLVRDDHNPDPARILQPVDGEVDPFLPAVQEPDVDLTEVKLRKFTGDALEADHHLRGKHSLLELKHPVEGALAERRAFLPQLTEDLQRRSFWIGEHQLLHPEANAVGNGRPTPRPRLA